MKLDARSLAPPLAALLILALILTLTREALLLSGAWQKASAAAAAAPSPFAVLENEIAAPDPATGPVTRDPFSLGSTTVAITAPRRPVKQVKPVPPPIPVLTSIIFDADPRATVKWDGRDYSIRPGGLFADFRVMTIARDQVVLDHGGESVVLRLPKRGEN